MSSLTSFSIHLQSHGGQGAGSASSRAGTLRERNQGSRGVGLEGNDVRSNPNGGVAFVQKIGDARAPRSAGCSKMNSAPALCAARSRAVVRRTISLACASSR
eukprot:524413-Pleurochrysis_carterae.AAC.2